MRQPEQEVGDPLLFVGVVDGDEDPPHVRGEKTALVDWLPDVGDEVEVAVGRILDLGEDRSGENRDDDHHQHRSHRHHRASPVVIGLVIIIIVKGKRRNRDSRRASSPPRFRNRGRAMPAAPRWKRDR